MPPFGLNESPELIAQEFRQPTGRRCRRGDASMKVLSLLLRNNYERGMYSALTEASMKVLSLLLRNPNAAC